MAGAAQGNRAGPDASSGTAGPLHSRWHRPVGRNPWLAQHWCGANPDGLREAAEIERAVTAFARLERRPDRDVEHPAAVHRDLIIALAARHRLPAIYSERDFVTGGGLISYGADLIRTPDAAGYVDRILKAKSRRTCRCRRRPSTSG